MAFASDAQMKQALGACRTTKLLPSSVLTVTSPCDFKKVILTSELKVDSNWRGGGGGALLQGHALALDQ